MKAINVNDGLTEIVGTQYNYEVLKNVAVNFSLLLTLIIGYTMPCIYTYLKYTNINNVRLSSMMKMTTKYINKVETKIFGHLMTYSHFSNKEWIIQKEISY